MTQHTHVAKPERRYTRVDFAALRFLLNGFPTSSFIERLYREEDLQTRGVNSPHDLERWLTVLRDNLVERARKANPLVAQLLEDSRKSGRWTKSGVDFIVSAAESGLHAPQPADPIAVWLKLIVARIFLAEGLETLGDLKAHIERRGAGWYRPLPRIGAGKAKAIERWLSSQPTLGQLVVPPDALPSGQLVVLHPGNASLMPLERIGSITPALDGRQGLNRNTAYCLISARNDLEAIQAYLYKFRERPPTERAYRKELERFLLWCVCLRRIPLSSVLTDECEAYKDFLAKPAEAWIGPKHNRTSPLWRPFAGPLAPGSQRYAVQALRSFFEWLMRVRYLGGNPWITVGDPSVDTKELAMAIDKALPGELWHRLIAPGGVLDQVCLPFAALPSPRSLPLGAKAASTQGAQYRLARAAILLLGFTGVRRVEAAGATVDKLKPVREKMGSSTPLWELAVLGKRRKWRTVFLPERVIAAIQAHWLDRGKVLNSKSFETLGSQALLSPLVVLPTQSAQAKHIDKDDTLSGNGFSPDGLYQVIKTMLLRLAADPEVALSEDERALLRQAAPHAFRHTFATQAAARNMPIDVLQRLLGHTSQQTTSIYVQAERHRSIAEVSRLFDVDEAPLA